MSLACHSVCDQSADDDHRARVPGSFCLVLFHSLHDALVHTVYGEAHNVHIPGSKMEEKVKERTSLAPSPPTSPWALRADSEVNHITSTHMLLATT